MKNRKSRVLKAMGFSSLALVMGAIGTLAFAPLNLAQISSASEAEMTTEQGLITPKADDPVIYTTESGLEIKYGNSAPSTYNQSLSSGNLKGFPYFTTTANSTTYTWVIIGRNSNVYAFNYSNMASFLFSTWKTNSTQTYQLGANGTYFFKNIYESTTPAGSAINNVVPSKSYVMDGSPLVHNAEIPSGCVLCLLNSIAETSSFASSRSDSTNYYSNASNKIRSKCEGFYSNDTFGFGTLLSSLQNITVSQGNVYAPSTWSWSQTSVSNQKFFPLNADYSYPGTSNFKYTSYLTSAQFALGTTFWTRGHSGGGSPMHIDESGVETGADQNSTSSWTTARGIRPACVIKLV
ncbi:MAG: hypothetical protein IJF22_02075 [Clostridia bacterium]|nr:hypothetical protein [Clostridia bacterium]